MNRQLYYMDGAVFYVPPTQYRLYGRRFLQHYNKNSYVHAYRLILNNTTKLLILPFILMLNVDFFPINCYNFYLV